MLVSGIIGLSVGAVLARHFTVFILFPVIVLTPLLVIGTEMRLDSAIWTTAMTVAMVVIDLQIGYLCGLSIDD